jgi:hypothetical protein
MQPQTEILLIVFVALTGIAVALQACVLFAIFVSLKKMAQATDDIKATMLPMVHSTRELMERLSPSVLTISTGIAELTEMLHKESKDVRISVSEIIERVNRQTERIDTMLTTGLDTVERAGSVLESTLALPVRQANGIVAAIKAMIETYRSTKPHHSVRYPDPEDPGI